MVLSVDRSGGRWDRTETFAAGSASVPMDYATLGEETLYFCTGDYYALITTSYSLDLVGVAGATQTALSGASHGTVLAIEGDGLTVTVDGLSIEGGQASSAPSTVADEAGGGVQCVGESLVEFTNSTIHDNTAEDVGGGVYLEGCDLLMESTEAFRNEADSLGGGIAVVGGTVTVKESSLYSNTASLYGGGIWTGYSEEKTSTIDIVDSGIYGNTGSYWGGGLAIDGGAAVTCTAGTGDYGIYGNTSSLEGGGIMLLDGSFSSTGCDFGEKGSGVAPNEPDTIYTGDSNQSYVYLNDAEFSCTDGGCGSS